MGNLHLFLFVLYTEQTEFNAIFVLLHGLKKEKKKKKGTGSNSEKHNQFKELTIR